MRLGQKWFMRQISQLRDHYKTLGAARFWGLMLAVALLLVVLIVPYVWLAEKINWPDAYGFRCRGRGCFVPSLAHSEKLLRGSSWYELALFIWLWLMPTVLAGSAMYAIVSRLWLKRGRRRIRTAGWGDRLR
jgi:hypothetical protein